MKSIIRGVVALVLVAATAQTNAGYCDYCGTGGDQGEWSCRGAFVTLNGIQTPSGTYCTYFRQASGSYTPSTWPDFWDRNYAGGNGAFRFGIKLVVNNFVENTIEATCASDVTTRWLHASFDTKLSQARALAGNGYLAKTNELVRVSYDDGSTEIWKTIAPLSSAPLFDVPIPNSLKCAPQ